MNELFRALLMLPPQGSTLARDVDILHYFVITTTMAGATFVGALALFYILRYRRKAKRGDPRPPDAEKRTTSGGTPLWLEGLIIAGLLSLFCAFWAVGFRQYVAMRVVPEGAIEVYVTAKKWMWTFAHPDGRRSNALLYVPVGRPVKLIMSSRDVIHSFYVPAFRIKQDVVPGRVTTVWFEAVEPGTYWILCAEYCGTDHSTMRGQVVVLSAEDYERHLQGDPSFHVPGPAYEPPGVVFDQPKESLSLAAAGERQAAEHGCLRCHTVDGTPHIGPTWAGAFGAEIGLDDGSRLVVDEAYLTESMMDPMAKIRRGYPDVMPSYQGLLGPAETGAIVEYIKSLRTGARQRDPLPEGPIEISEEALVAPEESPEREQRPERHKAPRGQKGVEQAEPPGRGP